MYKRLIWIIVLLYCNCSLFGQVNITDSFIHQTYQRKYIVHLPTGFNIGTKRPLVINLHGGSGNMQSAQGFSLMNPVADLNNFIVCYPQGYGIASPGYSWADGRNTTADQAGIDDLGFINKLMDTLITKYYIDANKIYICGFSNGGFMVQRIACQLNERFSAMASLGSSMDTVLYRNCNPSKSIPFAFFNGTADPAMPYGGGVMQNPLVIPVMPVDSVINFWVRKNKCLSANTVFNFADTFTTDNSIAELYSYTNCDCNASIKFYKLINGGHTWPGVYIASQATILGNTNRDLDASTELWNFFKTYSLCAPLGVDNKSTPSSFLIYPNPTTSELYINNGNNLEHTISISTYTGQKIISTKNQNRIDVSALKKGLFWVTIQQGNKSYTQKFIKE
jgi:polyhydroxybutyrate depolymerase